MPPPPSPMPARRIINSISASRKGAMSHDVKPSRRRIRRAVVAADVTAPSSRVESTGIRVIGNSERRVVRRVGWSVGIIFLFLFRRSGCSACGTLPAQGAASGCIGKGGGRANLPLREQRQSQLLQSLYDRKSVQSTAVPSVNCDHVARRIMAATVLDARKGEARK